MKIQLTADIPVPPLLKMTKGRIFEARENEFYPSHPHRWIVTGDTGTEVLIFEREAKIVEDEADED